jgi:hypothetical protein
LDKTDKPFVLPGGRPFRRPAAKKHAFILMQCIPDLFVQLLREQCREARRTAKMTNNLVPKLVECKCGHTFESSKHKSWCEKCCRPVFYHSKDQRRHQLSSYYLITMMISAMVFVTYLFLEMIAKPLLSL